MAEQAQYGSGLYRAPYGYEWAQGPRKHLQKRKSSARCARITQQLIERLRCHAECVSNHQDTTGCFTSRAQQILAEAVGKGAVVR